MGVQAKKEKTFAAACRRPVPPPPSKSTLVLGSRMRLSLSIVAAALLLSLGAASPASRCEAVGHRNAGLPLAKKVITVKNKDAEISVAYPRTGNKAIDAVLTAYAQQSVALFKTYHP